MAAPRVGKDAIVIGAGIAGLTAAAALAGHFERVIVLDRDSLPAQPAPRAGTPQARHLHVLLAGGQHALERLLPGFGARLVQAGAVQLRTGLDVRVERPGFDPFPMRDLGMRTAAISRPALEHALRQSVQSLPNILLQPNCRVTEIVADAAGAAVGAVRFDDAQHRSQQLPADLVVDASGRAQPTLALLQATGRGAPRESTIGVDIGYATATFEIPADASTQWKGVATLPQAPQSSRGGLMLPIEGGHWILSVGGRGNDKPPGDEAGFMAYVRGMRTPTIYEAIRDARRVGEIVRYAFPQSLRRHFDEGPALPRGLLPIGDAICSFNPVFGQGMSVAAQQAVLLREVLDAPAPGADALATLGPRYVAQLPALLETPWLSAAIPDFIFPDTTGERPADLQRSLKFGLALTRLAARKPQVHQLMMEVQNLVKPRSAFRRPGLMLQLMWEMRRG